ARAAVEAGVALAHIEAGLRSYDESMPEEHNRVETDRLSALLFCPDERSRAILETEGVDGRAEVVGDVMMDANLRFAPIARERSQVLERLGLEPGRYVVATLHREANVAEPRLSRILDGLARIDEPIVFPAHPRTRAALDMSRCLAPGHVRLVEPLGYLDFAALASQARVIVTDSGGLQKEAYWYGVPCVTARPSTEWVDTVELGANVLVDDDPALLARAVAGARMPYDLPPLYGDGAAAERVAATLARRDA
ncbi:MAG TPA: UDP-N-acetylglucosamine 2-epimerase, partial [Gaiellaceae bacterium]|nr:UDP-N-acetylglucosamine 2-epimerase [Gaiellaceae bacterium]